MEPFFTIGAATNGAMDRFAEVFDYAKEVKRIAKETDCIFIPLQKPFDEAIKNGGEVQLLYDGIHPNPGGAHLIAIEWLKVFKKL